MSALAADRLARARDFVSSTPPGTRILIVGASRGAADDLARAAAAALPATFGVQRLSLTQLAARTAMVALAGRGLTPSTHLGADAVAARVAFDATRDNALQYFSRVSSTPGFPRALARTLQELRLAGVPARGLAALPLAGRDLAAFLDRFDAGFESAGAADRAELFLTAAGLLRQSPAADVVVLLDVPVDHAAERAVIDALIAGATRSLATVPDGDRDAVRHYQEAGAEVEEIRADGHGDLACLRRYLFSSDAPPEQRPLDGSLDFFSAPGEGREAVEIARRVLKEARRGVPFDEMAILVRSPHSYFGLLEHALGRANVPAWFDRGTRRPHPAGRAFLALLACAAEQLSAARFAEYLSLGQVPHATEGAAWAASHDEAFGRAADVHGDEGDIEREVSNAAPADDAGPIAAGTLRAPWRWEKLLVESAVIGQTAARWERRLGGMEHELQLQIGQAGREEGGPESARAAALQHTLEQLRYLRAFALPLVRELSEWPGSATWGEWLDRFEPLVPRVLRMPSYVLRVLADLRPMAAVGPVNLEEVRRVLSERLLTLESEPPSRRFGRVFVGTPQQARGRSFRVVFVPGLAERMFPQKPREDPLLLDALRTSVNSQLPTSDAHLPLQRHRLGAERLLLQLAAGAASERLYVSYPRIELSESRARVPSFYALDVMRAATGVVPDHEALEERARAAGNAMLAWPAPPLAEDAIDDQEHDLAVLRELIDERDPAAVKGHAHYLLRLNEALRRSVIDRWARSDRRWSVNDGLTRVAPAIGGALAARRLGERAYSLSALQRFSACPYQFVLAAFYRLQPLQQPEPLQRMDPLTRGSIFHDIQARFFRALQAAGALPTTSATIDAARQALDRVIDDVAAREHESLAPAVERVWDDEVAALRRDLHAWLEYAATEGAEWVPKHFEYAFGSVPGERDASSRRDHVTLEGGFRLKGAIDLIEEHRTRGVLRVTDHKTGRKPERIERVIVGGGAVLQPVLYALAVEAALGRPVSQGRLFYCTSAGSFYSHEIPLNERTRAAGLEVLQVIDRAIATGFLAAAPAEEACDRCDFRCVCGPGVLRRVRRKPQGALEDLMALRSRP
jgi:CRISPR/Cas system-associated exonuclease Cas4 (RecB family)